MNNRTFVCLACAAGLTISLAVSADESVPQTIKADVWVDNWFALYAGDELVKEDSVPYNTEHSFNAESFTFDADLPAVLSVVIKDFKENDSGLDYIGSRRQQMGDGGFSRVAWQPCAKLIWTEDLEMDNTVLCRFTIAPE